MIHTKLRIILYFSIEIIYYCTVHRDFKQLYGCIVSCQVNEQISTIVYCKPKCLGCSTEPREKKKNWDTAILNLTRLTRTQTPSMYSFFSYTAVT